MLCSKCYEKIPQGAEIQIEGTIVCKKCSVVVKVVTKCCTCLWPIYKGDLAHENSGSISIGIAGFINFTRNGKSIQCDWCYKQWLNELKKEEKWWKENKKMLWTCVFLLLSLGVSLLFIEPWVSLIFFILLIILATLPTLRSLLISADRYEFRKRKSKQ